MAGLGLCFGRSEEHTSELQSRLHLGCRLLLGKTSSAAQAADWDRVGPALVAPGAGTPLQLSCKTWHSLGGRSGIPPPRLALPFFFKEAAATEIHPLSLHDALPI